MSYLIGIFTGYKWKLLYGIEVNVVFTEYFYKSVQYNCTHFSGKDKEFVGICPSYTNNSMHMCRFGRINCAD